MTWTDVEALPSCVNKKLVAALRQIVPETVRFEVFSDGVHHKTTEYVENKKKLCKRSSFLARKIENQDFKLVIKRELTLETFFEWVGFGKDEMAKQIGKKVGGNTDQAVDTQRLSGGSRAPDTDYGGTGISPTPGDHQYGQAGLRGRRLRTWLEVLSGYCHRLVPCLSISRARRDCRLTGQQFDATERDLQEQWLPFSPDCV